MLEVNLKLLTSFLGFAASVRGVPAGFPPSGNGLWYQSPGAVWSKEWLPIGNGYLGAMMPGGTSQEITQLNIESLWSGGPFQDQSYNGGNKQPSERTQMAEDMQAIRQTIFRNGTIDDIEELCTDAGAYGSYAGAGYLITSMESLIDTHVSNYARWLDLDQAVSGTTWSQTNETILRTSFCSHATSACIQHLQVGTNSQNNNTLPIVEHTFSAGLEDGLPLANVTCFDDATLLVQGNIALPGMAYEFLFRVAALGTHAQTSCRTIGTGENATLTVANASETWITWVGDTEYDLNAGDESHEYSFSMPLSEIHQSLIATLDSVTDGTLTYAELLSAHASTYRSNLGDMTLTFGATQNLDFSSLQPTDAAKAAYATDVGDPYLELLLFNYGRYLLASSAPGTLPANLQGKWALDISNPWSGDYHSNINLQMNYWFAEMTGMPPNVVTPLFDYIEKTWAPRGAETAQTLYNISRGWVTHDEMNIFGHTGMKLLGNSAEWANYPESAVWLMMHVYDHFDYTRNVTWWRAQGWPLLKAVASFQLDKLISDAHFKDGTLVTAPCNSPEQIPITFGCAHAQQLIWQLLNSIEKGWGPSEDSDTSFIEEVRAKRNQMDKGIHIGAWGQLQEWKIDMDNPNDTHRHLSHLIGLYPGYAIASYDPTLQGLPLSNETTRLTKSVVLNATKISLIHRGNGTGADGDAGWEKVWRAAAWAQFGDAEEYYHQLTYAIERNYGPNLFSLYDPLDADPIFQIDANLGFPAAVLNALVQAPDVPNNTSPLVITLLPALPAAWSSGSIKNLHLRGGILCDMDWAGGRPTDVRLKFAFADQPLTRTIVVVFQTKQVSLTMTDGQSYSIDV